MVAKWPSEIAQRLFDLAVANKVTLLGSGASIFYGDQNKLPTTPTLCIEAGPVARSLSGVALGGIVTNTFEAYILLYHSEVQDIQVNKKESEQFAEALVNFYDSNLTLHNGAGSDPLVIHGYCTVVDPGYAVKGSTLYRAVRITWSGITKTRLGA